MSISNLGRRAVWQELYSKKLPSLAKAKDSAQTKWPVVLDHCFGRIILDHVVGDGKVAWNERIKGPAIRNMTDEQVEACIDLGEKIVSGEADLVELDEQSLAARGKKSKHFSESSSLTKSKRKRDVTEQGSDQNPAVKQQKGSEDDRPASDEEGSGREDALHSVKDEGSSTSTSPKHDAPHTGKAQTNSQRSKEQSRKDASLEELQDLVKTSSLVEYRKQILLALLQVPRGKYTTYGAISDFLGSSPRAIGNGMRHNPFAPEVPCHRVLAADGKIGGYCGQWGEGNLIDKKRKILREEGVRFDGKGKVVGPPWRGFKKSNVNCTIEAEQTPLQ